MFYVDANPENILKLNIANHKKLNNIAKVIIAKMKLNYESSHEDYFKLKNIVAIYALCKCLVCHVTLHSCSRGIIQL